MTFDTEYLTKLLDEDQLDGQPLLDAVDDTRRKYTRKGCFMAVDYAISDIAFKGFIKNISPNGVFIETHGTFPPGRHVTMAFSSPLDEKPVKTSGHIVRSVQRGIGVALDTENRNLRLLVESLV
jgi:hypothetical protein